MQGDFQNKETKKCSLYKRTEQNSRKITKQNRDNQLIRWQSSKQWDLDAQRTHWVWQQHKKDEEEIKVTLSEIKKYLLGTNRGGDEAGIQINDLEHKEEISIQPKQQEEKRIKNNNNKDSIRTFWDISKCTNIWIIEIPEGEEEEKEIENLF